MKAIEMGKIIKNTNCKVKVQKWLTKSTSIT